MRVHESKKQGLSGTWLDTGQRVQSFPGIVPLLKSGETSERFYALFMSVRRSLWILLQFVWEISSVSSAPVALTVRSLVFTEKPQKFMLVTQ